MLATGRDMKREGGIAILDGANKEAANGLLAQLKEYGIFVVPGGELESWLKALGVTGKGPQWLIKIFESMGDDPDAGNYVRPAESDVWQFVASIRSWLVNADRKGIPTAPETQLQVGTAD
jgi:hypothetical protein